MRRSEKAILLFFSCICVPAASQTASPDELRAAVADLLPDLEADRLDELFETGELTNMYEAPAQPVFAPAFSSVIARELEELNPALGVEVLVLQPTPATGLTLPYSILQSFSTMEGIEYFSVSRGYSRTLFLESYVVDGPETLNRLPDPRVAAVPDSERLYVFQRDSSFGRNVYEITYRADSVAVLLSMRNVTRMMYRGLVPAVGPNKLLFHIAVVPGDGFTLLYGSSGADTLSAMGMEERSRVSFYNRIVALHSWYLDRLTFELAR